MNPAKPTALKNLQGNPGKRAINHREPQPNPARPRPPKWLSKAARKQWDRLAKDLHDCGLLTSIDQLALALLCENYSMWYDAKLLVEVEGFFCRSDNGNLYQHPAVGAMNTAQKNLISLMREFGMTPSSRSTIKIPVEGEGEKSLADMLFEAISQ
jgi:P27 family predicted phage terminase small subunit